MVGPAVTEKKLCRFKLARVEALLLRTFLNGGPLSKVRAWPSCVMVTSGRSQVFLWF